MLAHRLQRWPNIKTTLVYRVEFAGMMPGAFFMVLSKWPKTSRLEISSGYAHHTRNDIAIRRRLILQIYTVTNARLNWQWSDINSAEFSNKVLSNVALSAHTTPWFSLRDPPPPAVTIDIVVLIYEVQSKQL